jgi:hypothetical protein
MPTFRNRVPFNIDNEEQLRDLWAQFRDFLEGEYADPNWKTRSTGAALFVDFLCGVKPRKRTSRTSYLGYPEKPWPE